MVTPRTPRKGELPFRRSSPMSWSLIQHPTGTAGLPAHDPPYEDMHRASGLRSSEICGPQRPLGLRHGHGSSGAPRLTCLVVASHQEVVDRHDRTPGLVMEQQMSLPLGDEQARGRYATREG